jgi:1-acyl-sn-glycerol-3-phosphate acyltransferase
MTAKIRKDILGKPESDTGVRSVHLPVSLFRAFRLILHLLYGMLQAVTYPHLDPDRQHRTLKRWSRELLAILNIGLQIEGAQPAHREGGCLIVANHISWLDIYVLNMIHPARFIAKSEVRDWPIIGWLASRCGTIFIARATRQDTSKINRQVSRLLEQGAHIGLFPEGTTTDGSRIGHFHSSLLQPAIDSGARLCPIALRYQDDDGKLGSAAVFIGETTLAQSIWRILRCKRLNALVMFTPALPTGSGNRRVLALTAQTAIARALQDAATIRPAAGLQPAQTNAHDPISARSAYALLVDPLLKHPVR